MSPTGQYPNQLFTRFEIPFDTDISEIRTHSSNFNVMSGILRVAGESGTNRDIQLSAVGKDNETTPRWAVRADSLEEAGDNTGANLQFVRYGDDGEVLDSPLTMRDGNIGIGTSEPDTKLDVNGDMRLREKYTPASSTALQPGTDLLGRPICICLRCPKQLEKDRTILLVYAADLYPDQRLFVEALFEYLKRFCESYRTSVASACNET